MIRRFAQCAFILISVLFLHTSALAAPDGKALFMSNCASCHHPIKKSTGPALKGADSRVPSKEWLYNWVHNSAKVISSGDAYANKIYNEYAKTAMTAFPNLSTEEIDAIIVYVNSVEDKKPGADPAAAGAGAAKEEGGSWIYAVITGCLLLLGIILWRVNSGLRQAAHKKENIATEEEIPLYRNKVFIALTCIIIFILCGYWIVNGAIEMGRQQNYQPEQPIFYSHKVHAGVNQVNCLYCHAGAEKSRQAMIPSGNVCMNCHMQIGEYTGEEKLVTAEGREVNGTEEIQKLYTYTGWDPAKGEYKRKANGEIDAKPIPWNKIHNLADHVYFNHSQHVAVGKVQCQRCHGDIQNMDEVYQFSPLSMGWCINCHRQTKVQFESNNYYSIFEKYHKELKAGEREGVTVEDIGGLECQKCHY